MSPYRRHTSVEASLALKRLEATLAAYRAENERLVAELGKAVADCLGAQATWGEVGTVVGITKQAARARWGPFVTHAGTVPVEGEPLDSEARADTPEPSH